MKKIKNLRENSLKLFKKVQRILGLILCLWGTHVMAYNLNSQPIQMLENVSQTVLHELRDRRVSTTNQNNVALIHSIVKRVLLPHVAVDIMARSVVGRNHWMRATPIQRQQFIQEFVRLVTGTYATALSSYQDQKIRFLPIRGGIQGRRRVQVNSLIIHPNGPSIPVNYRLILLKNQWKIYDLIVENVSLVQSYRSQFAEELNQQGLAGLIQQLVRHNRATL